MNIDMRLKLKPNVCASERQDLSPAADERVFYWRSSSSRFEAPIPANSFSLKARKRVALASNLERTNLIHYAASLLERFINIPRRYTSEMNSNVFLSSSSGSFAVPDVTVLASC